MRIRYTVSDVMEQTNQKRGTIEQFRNELVRHHLLLNNQGLDERNLDTLKQAILLKETEGVGWQEAFQRAIQDAYSDEMKWPFEWTNHIILKYLIREVTTGGFESVDRLGDLNSADSSNVYMLIIDNFIELGKKDPTYNKSFGTDGNPVTTYKLTGKDDFYYVVGKYNAVTQSEDIHIFYNDGLRFSPMKCRHVCAGKANIGQMKELWVACSKRTEKIPTE